MGSKSTSLSAQIHTWVQAVRYNLLSFGCFFLVFPSWSCHCLSWDWFSSLPLLGLGSVYVGQGSMIRFFGSRISFLSSWFFFLVHCLGELESINVAGILQKAGDADSRAARNAMPCPLYCYYKQMGNEINKGWLTYFRVWVGGQGVIIISYFLVFLLWFCILLSHVLSPFIYVARTWWLLCLCLCFFIIFSVSGPFDHELLVQKNCYACCVKYFRNRLSDNYSVGFLGKGRMFSFQSLFRVCLPYYIHR